jgi:hypothetical protein
MASRGRLSLAVHGALQIVSEIPGVIAAKHLFVIRAIFLNGP